MPVAGGSGQPLDVTIAEHGRSFNSFLNFLRDFILPVSHFVARAAHGPQWTAFRSEYVNGWFAFLLDSGLRQDFAQGGQGGTELVHQRSWDV